MNSCTELDGRKELKANIIILCACAFDGLLTWLLV